MAGEEGVLELRQDGVLVAQHDREQRLAGLDLGDGVAPQLLLDRDGGPARLAELAERGGGGVSGCRRHDRQPIAGSAPTASARGATSAAGTVAAPWS